MVRIRLTLSFWGSVHYDYRRSIIGASGLGDAHCAWWPPGFRVCVWKLMTSCVRNKFGFDNNVRFHWKWEHGWTADTFVADWQKCSSNGFCSQQGLSRGSFLIVPHKSCLLRFKDGCYFVVCQLSSFVLNFTPCNKNLMRKVISSIFVIDWKSFVAIAERIIIWHKMSLWYQDMVSNYSIEIFWLPHSQPRAAILRKITSQCSICKWEIISSALPNQPKVENFSAAVLIARHEHVRKLFFCNLGNVTFCIVNQLDHLSQNCRGAREMKCLTSAVKHGMIQFCEMKRKGWVGALPRSASVTFSANNRNAAQPNVGPNFVFSIWNNQSGINETSFLRLDIAKVSMILVN